MKPKAAKKKLREVLRQGETKPEFIRLPSEGQFLEGLSRRTLYRLISGPKPAVKSVSLRLPGCTKGIRLIHRESLLAYLHSFENE